MFGRATIRLGIGPHSSCYYLACNKQQMFNVMSRFMFPVLFCSHFQLHVVSERFFRIILSGPVMLLELCDMPLKDWLTDNSTFNADILEDISVFVLNIARAVEFLHSQQVTFVYFHTLLFILKSISTCRYRRH